MKVASEMLSTPPLTATASGPAMLDKTAANRAWTLPLAWCACISEPFLRFVSGGIPVPIARVQGQRHRFAPQARTCDVAAMAHHIGGLRLASHSPRPVDDFDL